MYYFSWLWSWCEGQTMHSWQSCLILDMCISWQDTVYHSWWPVNLTFCEYRYRTRILIISLIFSTGMYVNSWQDCVFAPFLMMSDLDLLCEAYTIKFFLSFGGITLLTFLWYLIQLSKLTKSLLPYFRYYYMYSVKSDKLVWCKSPHL